MPYCSFAAGLLSFGRPMTQNKELPRSVPGPGSLKRCPWCGGALVFASAFPLTRLAAGEFRSIRDDDIPAPLKTVPAWTCGTPHCKYREPA